MTSLKFGDCIISSTVLRPAHWYETLILGPSPQNTSASVAIPRSLKMSDTELRQIPENAGGTPSLPVALAYRAMDMATNALMYRQHAALWLGSEHAAEASVKFAQLKSKGQPPTAAAAGFGDNQYGAESESSKRSIGPAAAARRRRGSAVILRVGGSGVWSVEED